jgi:uncharacterized RDD family membrane protein YckC
MSVTAEPHALASLPRRLASLFYDALLLAGVLFLAGFLVAGLVPAAPTGLPRLLYQGYLFMVCGVYFTWYWRHGGQTLAMKTWRIRVTRIDGTPLGLNQAWLRFFLAGVGLACLGLGFLWAAIDPRRQYLHDRLARTRLIRTDG